MSVCFFFGLDEDGGDWLFHIIDFRLQRCLAAEFKIGEGAVVCILQTDSDSSILESCFRGVDLIVTGGVLDAQA